MTPTTPHTPSTTTPADPTPADLTPADLTPADLTPEERVDLIERYSGGHAAVLASLADVTEEELDRCRPGEWSARQVVHHLADSETTSYVRLRMLLAQEQPAIAAYDENVFARELSYERPVGLSLDVLAAVRASSAELLRLLTAEQWARTGTHSETGAYSMHDWLRIYAAHAHDHADQIRRARQGLK